MFFFSLRIPLLVSLLLSPISTLAQNDNSSPLQGVFPPLTRFINYGNLIISYESSKFILQGNVNSGVEVTPNDTSIAPNAIAVTPFKGYGNPFFPINKTQLYTLVMIDPDVPSRANPTSQVLHFVQTRLQITTGLGGSTETEYLGLTSKVPPLVPYRGPAPPPGSGLHRYIFLLFMQSSDTIDLGSSSTQDNGWSFAADSGWNFNIESFAKSNRFGPPLAGAYFQAQNIGNGGNTRIGDDIVIDPSVDDPLLVDTNTPTPPARQTSQPTTDNEIVYRATLTHSLPASMTSGIYAGPQTDSVQPGDIGHWTMTAPGGVDEQLVATTTETSTVPAPTTLERITGTASSLPTPKGSSDSTSVVGIQNAGPENPSASSSIPSWLNGGNHQNSAGEKTAEVTMLMGVVAVCTVYIISIL